MHMQHALSLSIQRLSSLIQTPHILIKFRLLDQEEFYGVLVAACTNPELVELSIAHHASNPTLEREESDLLVSQREGAGYWVHLGCGCGYVQGWGSCAHCDALRHPIMPLSRPLTPLSAPTPL